jgi:hypothetical protein
MGKSMMMQKLVLTLAAILTFEACSTGHSPASSPSTPVPHADTAAIDLRSNSWTPRIMVGTRRYFIRDSSTVSINNDTTSRVLPIESTMIYSISITDMGSSFALNSRIDSLTVSTQLPMRNNSDTAKVAEFHTLLSKQGQVVPTPEQAKVACAGTSTAASSRIGELIINLPSTRLKVGDKWTDTASTTNCHGKIPLVQQATREYELLDLSSCLQRDAVRVRRTVSDTFTGASAETTNHLSASGSGTSTAILCLQRDTGALIESNGQSRSDLIVVTNRGTFPFTQNVNTHIELR